MTTSKKSKRIFSVAALAAATLAFSAIVIPAQANASVESGVSAHGVTAKPTIVLVHGAWADGSSFAPQVLALQLAGYKVLVAPNPLRDIATDTKAVSDFIAQRTTGPVILVGHSYGGVVITGAALTDPDVKALVYIDAYAPDNNESVNDLTSQMPGSLLSVDPTTVFDFVLPSPTATLPEYDTYIKTDKFKAIFAASLPSAVTNVLAASQGGTRLAAVGGKFAGTPAWKTIPSWFFIGTNDKVIPPAEQRFMAQRAHGKVAEGSAPHLSMLDKPAQVTKVILAAALSVK